MGECVGQMGDVRAGLGVDLAALQAVAAVDAVRPVAEGAVDDPDRPDPHLDPARQCPRAQRRRRPGDRVRGERVAVRMPPRPVLPGHGQLPLDPLVVRAQVGVTDRPVRADPVVGEGGKVAGVEARGVAGVVDHRAAHPAPGVVLAQLDRVGSADHPLLGPVQVVAARLVGHPVLIGMPERARLQDHDLPAAPGQALGQHRAARACADDDQVDLVVVGVAAHGLLAGQVAGCHVEQEPGVVVARPDRTLEHAAPEVTHQTRRPRHRHGSCRGCRRRGRGRWRRGSRTAPARPPRHCPARPGA